MALIRYCDWLNKESTASKRAWNAAKDNLLPSGILIAHGVGGNRTEPFGQDALKKAERDIADDPNTLDKEPRKKRHHRKRNKKG